MYRVALILGRWQASVSRRYIDRFQLSCLVGGRTNVSRPGATISIGFMLCKLRIEAAGRHIGSISMTEISSGSNVNLGVCKSSLL